ncbi:MAG: TonB-dependent receptor [Cyclobacteriaceae bacterium]|nr:TonB-dependent receptor [Cyclobacteriaceae bacterium]
MAGSVNGQVTLSNSEDTGDLTRAGVDNLLIDSFEGNSTGSSEVISGYISDVINFSPSLSAMASVRFDRFEGKTAYWIEDEVEGQSAVSPKLGLVYQPFKDRVSLFANYMNGFVNVAPAQVSDVDGTNPRLKTFEPENANQFEFGMKTNLYQERVSATVSYYNILGQKQSDVGSK